MRQSNKFMVALGVLLLGAVGPVVLAQGPGRHGGDRGPGREGSQRLFEYLGLSEEQQQAWSDAHRAHFESLKPTFEKMRDLREQLHAELEGGSPDAATVGGYVISMHQLEDSLKGSRGDLDAAISEILTAEQETKLEAFKAANPDRHHGPGGPHGGGSHGGRPGFGGPRDGGPDRDPNA